MPVLTQAEKAQINVNKQKLVELSPSADKVILKGHTPSTVLEVESGGTAGAFQMYDMVAPIHMVSSIQWVKATQETDWTLSDKDTGVTKAMFQMKPNGTFHIGNGMTQHKIATLDDISNIPKYFDVLDKRAIDLDTLKTNGKYYTDGANRPIRSAKGVLEVFTDEVTGHTIQLTETDGDFKKYLRAFDGVSWSAWVEDNTSHVIGLAFNMIIGKASKTSLPTIYSGDSIPSNDLGKNYDRFHQYSAGTTVNEEITHGTSLENYSLNGIFLARFTDPIPASGVHTIEILPGQGRLIYIDLVHDKTLSTEELTLIIGNDSIVLEKLSNAAGSYSGVYPPSADAIIQGITDTTQYVLQAKTGHTDDKEVDYEKHHGVWEREDFLNNAKVNELIREYHTIIVMSLADDKKPTRAEAISAFKQLPHFNWTKNDTFYIRDSTGAKTMFCTYFADGATNEATAGKFFFKDMNECI